MAKGGGKDKARKRHDREDVHRAKLAAKEQRRADFLRAVRKPELPAHISRQSDISGASNLPRGAGGLFQKPLEPFTSQACGFVEPFTRIDLVVCYRKNRELFRLARPLAQVWNGSISGDLTLMPIENRVGLSGSIYGSSPT